MIRRLHWGIGLALTLSLSAGCTATLTTMRLLSADKALREAEDKNANIQAPYEYTLAEQHLRKAVEESAESEYRSSMELAKKAEELARQAILITEGGSRDIGNLDSTEDLTDEKAPEDGEGLRDAANPQDRAVDDPDEAEAPDKDEEDDDPFGDLLDEELDEEDEE